MNLAAISEINQIIVRISAIEGRMSSLTRGISLGCNAIKVMPYQTRTMEATITVSDLTSWRASLAKDVGNLQRLRAALSVDK